MGITRKRRRGAAILLVLLLGFVMFIFFSGSMQAHYHLHRQNRRAQARLQKRCAVLRVYPGDKPEAKH